MILVTLRLLPLFLRRLLFKSERKAPCIGVLSTFLAFSFGLFQLNAQEQWVDFIVERDTAVMAVSVDLRFYTAKPNYKNLLIVGTSFKNCMKNGFPKPEGLDELYPFSDSTAVAINKITKSELVGILTYKCLAFDVYYVKDTVGLRDEISTVLEESFAKSRNYLNIKRDKAWNYYFDFLISGGLTDDYLLDQKYLYDLVIQGDDLQGLRKVRHWVYFNKLKQRTKMADKLTSLKFSLDSINYVRDTPLPYELQFSRMDSITPDRISDLTSLLKILSEVYQGQYDGWGTELQTKD